jgi:hypothetical protein
MASIPANGSKRTWQSLFSADESHWQDLRRMGDVVIPAALLIFLTVMAAVAYAGLHGPDWAARAASAWGRFWWTVRLGMTVLAPLAFTGAALILFFRGTFGFMKAFYPSAGTTRLLRLLQLRLLGVPPLPFPLGNLWKYPFVTIREPGDLSEDHWVRWLGGPATLVIYDGTALYLVRGSRFSRVVGPGKPPMPFLDRYETVAAVVDLRPQIKTGTISRWTKDGIEVQIEIRMECQIGASSEARQASRNLVYPFDPVAVKQAVEYTAVKYDAARKELYESDWLDGVWGQVTGYLGRHISRHSVDEIALADDIEEADRGHLHTFRLAQRYIDEINADLAGRKCGAQVLNIQFMMKFPDEVNEQRMAYWESERKKMASIRDSKAEADRIRVREEARARAQRDVLGAITDRLKRVGPENLTEPLLLSLTGILDNSLDDPLVRPLIANSSLSLLEKLRKILKDRF